MKKQKIQNLESELGETYEEYGGLDNAPARELIKQIEIERGLNLDKIHEDLARIHGRYKDFNNLMDEYGRKAVRLDITGVLQVLNKYKNKMIAENQGHFLPIVDSLYKRAEEIALQCLGRTK